MRDQPDRSGKPGAAMPPVGALLFGVAGLIPFVALAAGIAFHLGIVPVLTAALQFYGAIVLSFLGGIRWGLTINATRPHSSLFEYGISILPPLVGWGAIFLSSLQMSYGVLAGAIVLWFALEVLFPPPVFLPFWYGRLRGALTFGAALSLIAAAFFWRL
jgi:hypothetical protein